MIIPVQFKEGILAKIDNEEIDVSNNTYVMIYKQKEEMTAELITKIPDSAFLNNPTKSKDFTGTVIIENWKGNFLKSFIYKFLDGEYKVFVSKSNDSKDDKLKGIITTVVCYQQEWIHKETGAPLSPTNHCYIQYSYVSDAVVWSGTQPRDYGTYTGGAGTTTTPVRQENTLATKLRNLNLIFTNKSCLTTDQKNTLASTLDKLLFPPTAESSDLMELRKACAHSAVFNALKAKVSAGTIPAFSFCIVDGPYNAVYRTNTKDIIFSTEFVLGSEVALDEELFHAFQDNTYKDGISQYQIDSMNNLEFERTLYQDILDGGLNAFSYADDAIKLKYKNWLADITAKYTKLPVSSDAFKTEYYYFLGEFNKISRYGVSTKVINMEPAALFGAFSMCK